MSIAEHFASNSFVQQHRTEGFSVVFSFVIFSINCGKFKKLCWKLMFKFHFFFSFLSPFFSLFQFLSSTVRQSQAYMSCIVFANSYNPYICSHQYIHCFLPDLPTSALIRNSMFIPVFRVYEISHLNHYFDCHICLSMCPSVRPFIHSFVTKFFSSN